MKRIYEDLELEIIRFESEDVITLSDEVSSLIENGTPVFNPEG